MKIQTDSTKQGNTCNMFFKKLVTNIIPKQTDFIFYFMRKKNQNVILAKKYIITSEFEDDRKSEGQRKHEEE